MDLIHRISTQFEDSARTTLDALEWLAAPIAGAVEVVTNCLLNNGKLLCCGVGFAARDADALATRLTGQFELARPALAAIALGVSAGQDCVDEGSVQSMLTRQLSALAGPGDVLVAIHLDGDSSALAEAITTARERDLRIVLLSGANAGTLADLLGDADIHVCVPSARVARIHETHRLALHCLCDGIDCLLLGVEDQ